MAQPPQLIGSVIERSASSKPKAEPTASSLSPSGFPPVQHRSQSAFARAREARRNLERGSNDGAAVGSTANERTVPVVKRASTTSRSHSVDEGDEGREEAVVVDSRAMVPGPSRDSDPRSLSKASEDERADTALPESVRRRGGEGGDKKNGQQWRAQMQAENEQAVGAMSDEEREQHLAEVLEQLGPNVAETLRRVREARGVRQAEEAGCNSTNAATSTGSSNGGTSISSGSGSGAVPVSASASASASQVEAPPTPVAVVDHFDENDSGKSNGNGNVAGDVNGLPLRPQRRESYTKELMTPSRGILVTNSAPGSRASSPSRAAAAKSRKLRFADVKAEDVHVYQSEPSSPRRPIALLPPPPSPSSQDEENEVGHTKIRADEYKGLRFRALPVEASESLPGPSYHSSSSDYESSTEPEPQSQSGLEVTLEPEEEGTPEDIRRRFFPSASPNDPSLEWLIARTPSEQDGFDNAFSSPSRSSASELRFDLTGALIPVAQRYTLPTHLGLHHHGGNADEAGYTMRELLLLSRSTVAAQRATVLGVLAKLVRRLVRGDSEVEDVKERDEVREGAVGAALHALSERGSLGAVAIDLVWACVVHWDEAAVDGVEGAELRPLQTVYSSNNSEEADHSETRATDTLSSLPYPSLLPQLAALLSSSSSALPVPSLTQLLEILDRMAHHSILIATHIAETPHLVGNVVSLFLLTPIPPPQANGLQDGFALMLPNDDAIAFLCTLARANREVAKTLEGPADALLRFVTTAIPIEASPFPRMLAEKLLCRTLELYSILASYGIYAGVATTAAEHFNRLSSQILSYPSSSSSFSASQPDGKNANNYNNKLKATWLRLLRTWLVCARDPHRTTPTHDLLWSQVSGWAWGDDLLAFRKTLLPLLHSKSGLLQGTEGVSASGEDSLDLNLRSNLNLWSELVAAISAWLEGCRMNSVRGGQEEVDRVRSALAEAWGTDTGTPFGAGEEEQEEKEEGSGPERKAVRATVASLRQELEKASSVNNRESKSGVRRQYFARIAELTSVLANFTRLYLACAPPAKESANGDALTNGVTSTNNSSWFSDAFEALSQIASEVVCSRIWEQDVDPQDASDELTLRLQTSHLRFASTFLAEFVRLAKTRLPQKDWLSLAFAVMRRLLPGDEETVLWIIGEVVDIDISQSGLGGSKIISLLPFFKNMVRPEAEVFVIASLLSETPESIQKCTTQTLPADYRPSTAARHARFGLPLDCAWPCIALDHLLRSGTSPVLTNPDSVPDSWNASEVDLVQASLALLLQVQTSLSIDADGIGGWFEGFALRSEDVVFTCMKVFMLEHNQQQTDSAEEIFRDSLVDRLVRDLLQPYSFGSASLQQTHRRGRRSRSRDRRQRTDSSASDPRRYTLEDASRSFLGAGTPFYQFYTDFVALYDAISFSHRTFARLLLPPTAMGYALDYRKLLWGDFGHVLRSIQIPVEEVIVAIAPSLDPNSDADERNGFGGGGGIGDYLWPHETDAEMIGWYLRALIKWPLDGFVRVIAVHHVACNIWPDLQHESESAPAAATRKERRSRMLLRAIMVQARPEVVRDVVSYVQVHQPDSRSEARLPPECFAIDERRKAQRFALVGEWGDGQMASTLQTLYAN